MARNDGYQVGPITIQGVRAYDAGAGQWTTPDAFKGNVHDPMSQKAYMWNDNNPILYEDPSGYETYCQGCQGQAPSTYNSCSQSCANNISNAGVNVVLAVVPIPGVDDVAAARLVSGLAEKLGVNDLIKAAAERFSGAAADHGVTGTPTLKIQSADKVKIQYRDGNGVRRDVMAHNGHPDPAHEGHIASQPHTQTATKGHTDANSHKKIL